LDERNLKTLLGAPKEYMATGVEMRPGCSRDVVVASGLRQIEEHFPALQLSA